MVGGTLGENGDNVVGGKAIKAVAAEENEIPPQRYLECVGDELAGEPKGLYDDLGKGELKRERASQR